MADLSSRVEALEALTITLQKLIAKVGRVDARRQKTEANVQYMQPELKNCMAEISGVIQHVEDIYGQSPATGRDPEPQTRVNQHDKVWDMPSTPETA